MISMDAMEHKTERARGFHGPAFSFPPEQKSRGDFTLKGAFMLLLVMALLVLFITALGVANDAMKLHSVAAELVRYIEIRGQVDDRARAELTRLAAATGITVERCDINATYISGTKLQFGASFDVTLATTSNFGIGGVLSVPVPLTSTVSGRSEQYWK